MIRLVVVAALLGGVVSGCSTGSPPSEPPAMPPNTATAAVDGKDTGGRLYVRCNQIQWLLTIDGGDEASGFTAMVGKGGTPEAKFVKIANLGGFTGSAWEGGSGELDVSRDGSVLNFTGTAYGYFAEAPNEPTTTGFRITTAC